MVNFSSTLGFFPKYLREFGKINQLTDDMNSDHLTLYYIGLIGVTLHVTTTSKDNEPFFPLYGYLIINVCLRSNIVPLIAKDTKLEVTPLDF